MLYELSDTQIESLKSLLNNATIKGTEAELIMDLKHAVSTPVKPKE